MNELLQKHGCANVFHIPDGLRELMSDISREVLRHQPANICEFIADYLSALLVTREHGILAVKLLDDLCDCKPSVSEHLIHIGMDKADAIVMADIIKEEIEAVDVTGKETVRELEILKRILERKPLDEEMTAQVCEIARNAYRDYWYRKKMLEQKLRDTPQEPWEKAAEHTLEIYKRTKPSFSEMNRAALRIQAAYRGFHTRRKILSRQPKKAGPKVDLPGPPLDIAGSREIDLGPIVDIGDKVKSEDVKGLFPKPKPDHIGYDTNKTLTHVPSQHFPADNYLDSCACDDQQLKPICDCADRDMTSACICEGEEWKFICDCGKPKSTGCLCEGSQMKPVCDCGKTKSSGCLCEGEELKPICDCGKTKSTGCLCESEELKPICDCGKAKSTGCLCEGEELKPICDCGKSMSTGCLCEGEELKLICDCGKPKSTAP